MRQELINFQQKLKKHYASKEFILLGEGSSSMVFHDNSNVYKVLKPDFIKHNSLKKHILEYIIEENVFSRSPFFYQIKELVNIEDHQVIVYPFEKSEHCLALILEEMVLFLAECWQYQLVFKDIKPKNFIRVNGHLRFIDYDPDIYSDNLFLNMAVRAFIYCKYPNKEITWIQKLARTAVNRFDLPELDGLQGFLNQVFAQIIFYQSEITKEEKCFSIYKIEDYKSIDEFIESNPNLESHNFRIPYSEKVNPEKLFFTFLNKGYYISFLGLSQVRLDKSNYFAPEKLSFSATKLCNPHQKVSLIIKACVQDSEILYNAVKHIVRQTASPDLFDERILALDIKSYSFLRQYSSNGSWDELIKQANILLSENIIHRIVIPTKEDIVQINKQWFGIDSGFSHTVKGVPVAPQLYAFNQSANEYILQVDCDAMIGRRNIWHSFLNDMIDQIESNSNVLSVGFNICKPASEGFNSYTGFIDGGFVPEVRFCLLHRSRVMSQIPFYNKELLEGLEYSWYRSMEIKQKENGMCSIRGGHSDSFFIHPPNYRKTDKDVWFTIIDRLEQNEIPVCQDNKFDLDGSYFDWCQSKRDENVVIISCFRNIPVSRFLRFWYSIVSQTYPEWGMILIDDASDNGISDFILEIIKPFKNKITFIRNRFRMGIAHNTNKAIHYFMQNNESVVVIVDGDDALLGKNTLFELISKYIHWEGDSVVGKMFRTDKIHAHYNYHPDFIRPREKGGNVWQHLRSFKKYLYDSLRFDDLKIKSICKENITNTNMIVSSNTNWKFPAHCWDYTYMVPIIEMSKTPLFSDKFNYYHDRSSTSSPEIRKTKEEIIASVLNKKEKSPEDVIRGRITFKPNLKRIEIDITYICNLNCPNCNRSCSQAPSNEYIDIDSIRKFINDSIILNWRWELINILGGEPTLHPQFHQIIKIILSDYVDHFSPDTMLQITSNGYGSFVRAQLKLLPQHPSLMVDYNSFKKSEIVPYFSPFNDAPIDHPEYDHSEYAKGCWVTAYCGIGFNTEGYFPCGVAGGIERIFKLNKGTKSLSEVTESIANKLEDYCLYCGNFTAYAANKGNFISRNEKAPLTEVIISPSWKEQYKKYIMRNSNP